MALSLEDHICRPNAVTLLFLYLQFGVLPIFYLSSSPMELLIMLNRNQQPPFVPWRMSAPCLSPSCSSPFSNSGMLECHLWSSNLASHRNLMIVSFNRCTSGMVSPPTMMSSTYRLVVTSSTIFKKRRQAIN